VWTTPLVAIGAGMRTGSSAFHDTCRRFRIVAEVLIFAVPRAWREVSS
jgi:hypothetical protein